MQKAGFSSLERPFRANAVFADDDDFARLHFADEFRVDEIEGAASRRRGCRRHRVCRTTSGRKPNGSRTRDDFALAHDDEAENAPSSRRSALRMLPPLCEGWARRCEDDFAVGRGLENGAFALQLVAQDGGVDQVAVVRDRDLAAEAIDHEGLRVFHRARAGRGIAGVPDRARALQALQFILRRKPARPAPCRDAAGSWSPGPFARDDAGALLSAMLERKEAVVGQDRRVRMTEDGKDAALVHRVGRSRRWKTWVLNHRPRKDTHSAANVTFGSR